MEIKPNDKKTSDMAKNTNKIEEPAYDSYSGISNTVSANECTGMMYAPPQNEEEYESYKETFSMQIPKKKNSVKE